MQLVAMTGNEATTTSLIIAEGVGLKPPVDESLGLELKTRSGVQALGAEKEKETGEIPWH